MLADWLTILVSSSPCIVRNENPSPCPVTATLLLLSCSPFIGFTRWQIWASGWSLQVESWLRVFFLLKNPLPAWILRGSLEYSEVFWIWRTRSFCLSWNHSCNLSSVCLEGWNVEDGRVAGADGPQAPITSLHLCPCHGLQEDLLSKNMYSKIENNEVLFF